MRGKRLSIFLIAAQVLAAVLSTSAIERVSVATGGVEANSDSCSSSISADGRYVAFASAASNLVPEDTTRQGDVFVHDRQTGTTERVSVATGGAEGDGLSDSPAISADGRYVAFVSLATNLVPGEANGQWGVFVHNRQTGTTERVSVATDGTQGNLGSGSPSISADGRFVAFISQATNLVLGDINGQDDVFVHDRQTGITERVGVFAKGSPSISADGRYVAYQSTDRSFVPGDTNGTDDVFVRDRQTGTTERVSVATDGTQGNLGSGAPSISADGRFVAFESFATNLVPGDTNGQCDVFVHDRQTGTTERASVSTEGVAGDKGGHWASISAAGRFVAFISQATNLVPGNANGKYEVFVHDRQAGTTTRGSVAADGTEGDGDSYNPTMSADGRYVAFASGATNLVPGDTNGHQDVFVQENPPPTPTPTATPTPTLTPTLTSTPPPTPTATAMHLSMLAKLSQVGGSPILTCIVKDGGDHRIASPTVSVDKATARKGPYAVWKSKKTNKKGQALFPLAKSKTTYYVRAPQRGACQGLKR